MSKIDPIAKEISSLRAEVMEIRRQQKENFDRNTATESTSINENGEMISNYADEVSDVLKSLLDKLKHEYDNLSPISAILIFSLGIALGSLLSKNSGVR